MKAIPVILAFATAQLLPLFPLRAPVNTSAAPPPAKCCCCPAGMCRCGCAEPAEEPARHDSAPPTGPTVSCACERGPLAPQNSPIRLDRLRPNAIAIPAAAALLGEFSRSLPRLLTDSAHGPPPDRASLDTILLLI